MKQQDEAREEVLLPFLDKTSLNTETLIRTEQHRLQQYLQFFDICHPDTSKLAEKDIISHLPSDISYSTEQFTSRLLIKITRHSKNYQLIDLEVRLGHFTFNRVSIIHINTASPVHDVYNCGSGAFCTVYRCEFDENILAFKCFSHQRIKCQDNSTSILEKVIQQYCLLRIASCFGVGPKMFDLFGFDIMIHPGCIQICMECCDPFPPKYMPKIKEYEQQLKLHLLTLHKLHIIHHDIKMQNICFSLVFNSLVFIDFGMSKIVKEELGFKTLTKYRGTLSYCGDQMAKLFQKGLNEKHYVDLYYNDMIGLKKTFENLRLDQFKHDIALIKRLRIKSDMIQRSVRNFYQIYVIKHQIFENQFNLQVIENLAYSTLHSLIQFINFLPFSLNIKRIYLNLSNLMKNINLQEERQIIPKEKFMYQITTNKRQENNVDIDQQNESTLINLRKVSIRNIAQYFLNGPARFDQLLDFLKTQKSAASINIEDYLCLLAKAIQFNASTAKLSQLNEICLVAQRRSEQFYAMQLNTKYLDENESCFFLAAQFLFKTAFRHSLKGKYFHIYCYIINNIFAFNMLSIEQLLQYYDSLLRFPLAFENKLLAIIKFHTGLIWIYINASSLNSYLTIKRQIQLRSLSYLNQSLQFSSNQANLLRAIWNRQDFKLDFSKDTILSKSTQLQMKMWVVIKLVSKLNFNSHLENQVMLIESELLFMTTTVIEYYHCFYMIFYYIHKQSKKLNDLIQKYKSVFRGRLNNKLVFTLQNIKIFQIKEYQFMLDNIFVFSTIQLCIHPITNFVAYNYFDQFVRVECKKFSLLKKETKKYILKLMIQFRSRFVSEIGDQILENRLFSLAKQIFGTTKISKRYEIQTMEEISGTNFEMGKQNYLELRNIIQKSSIIEERKSQHQKLFCLLTLIALLIKKNNIDKALQLGKLLYRVTKFTWTQQINRRKVLNIIFLQIIQQNDFSDQKKYRQRNRHLYFDYIKLLQDEGKEQLYIRNFSVFADIVTLLYKHKFEQLSIFINRISKKVSAFRCRYSSEKYFIANSIAFYKIKNQEGFRQNIFQLQKQLCLIDNPYNIFALTHIHRIKRKEQVNMSNFIYLFTIVGKVDIFAREIILHYLYQAFMYYKQLQLRHRKLIRLVKKIARYSPNKFTVFQLMNYFIPMKPLKILNNSENNKKKAGIKRAIKRIIQINHSRVENSTSRI